MGVFVMGNHANLLYLPYLGNLGPIKAIGGLGSKIHADLMTK